MDLPVQFPFIRLHVTVHSGACRCLAPRPANTPIYSESAVSGNRSCEQGGGGRHIGTKSTPRRCSNSLYRSEFQFFVQVCSFILRTGLTIDTFGKSKQATCTIYVAVTVNALCFLSEKNCRLLKQTWPLWFKKQHCS